jgi:hypothetical protein
VIAFTKTCVVADLDTATALSASERCARHKLATADAIVSATALVHETDPPRYDRRFEKLSGVRLVRKSSAPSFQTCAEFGSVYVRYNAVPASSNGTRC